MILFMCLMLNEMYYILQAFDGVGSWVCVLQQRYKAFHYLLIHIPHMITCIWAHRKIYFVNGLLL